MLADSEVWWTGSAASSTARSLAMAVYAEGERTPQESQLARMLWIACNIILAMPFPTYTVRLNC